MYLPNVWRLAVSFGVWCDNVNDEHRFIVRMAFITVNVIAKTVFRVRRVPTIFSGVFRLLSLQCGQTDRGSLQCSARLKTVERLMVSMRDALSRNWMHSYVGRSCAETLLQVMLGDSRMIVIINFTWAEFYIATNGK